MAGCCECGDEAPGSLKCGDFRTGGGTVVFLIGTLRSGVD